MEKLNFELGEIRSSQRAKQYAKDVFSKISTSQPSAQNAIFIELPSLIERLENELQDPRYRYERCLEFYRQRLQFPGVDPTPDTVAAHLIPIHDITELHNWAEAHGESFRRALDSILLWFQVLLPKCPSSGADTAQEILLQLTTQCQKAYDRTNAFYEDIIQYHQSRAEMLKSVQKNPDRDYLYALINFDSQEVRSCHAYAFETMLNAMTLYTGIAKNYELVRRMAKKEKPGVIY